MMMSGKSPNSKLHQLLQEEVMASPRTGQKGQQQQQIYGNMSSFNSSSASFSLHNNGYFVGRKQVFHLHPSHTSNFHSPPNLPEAPQQGIHNQQSATVHLKRRKTRAHHGSTLPIVQHYQVQQPFNQNVNEALAESTSTTTVRVPGQTVCTSTFVSRTAHNQQTGHNQNYRQSATKRGFSAVAPHRYRNIAPSSNSNSQNEMQKEIASIVDDLYNSFPLNACQPQHTSSPPTGRQLVSVDQMMGNQTVQHPSPAFATSSNLNHTNYLQSSTGQHLAKGTSGTHRTVPQTSFVPGGHGSENYNVSKGNVFGSPRNAPLPVQMYNGILPQRGEAVTGCVVESQNDSSIHSSSGCTGARAVAVVQPLSQENYQVAHKLTYADIERPVDKCTAADKSPCTPEKYLNSPVFTKEKDPLREFNLHHQNSNEKSYNVLHSTECNDDAIVSLSKCATPEDSQIHETSEHCVTPVAQLSVMPKLPLNQNEDIDKTESTTGDEVGFTDLSSIETRPWTLVQLSNLIQDHEKKQQELEDHSNSLTTILRLVNVHKVIHGIVSGSFKKLMNEVKHFCVEHLTPDAVILSEVAQSAVNQLNSCHVLKDDEVYSEPSYKSSWLNVNEEVDDIDKDFESKRRLEYVKTSTSEESNIGIDQIELEVNDPCEENFDSTSTYTSMPTAIPDEASCGDSSDPCYSFQMNPCEENLDSTSSDTLMPTANPDEAGCGDSSDPCYSFQINVLTPGEARAIFEQIQNKSAQSMVMDSQPKRATGSSVEEKKSEEQPDNQIFPCSNLKQKKKTSSVQQFCCLSRWMQDIVGSQTSLKCNCEKEQSPEDGSAMTPDKEEITNDKNTDLSVVMCLPNLSALIGDKFAENSENQNNTQIWNDPCTDLTGDDENSTEPSIVVRNESEVEPPNPSLISNQTQDFASPVPDIVMEYVQELSKSEDAEQSKNACYKQFTQVYSNEPVNEISDTTEACPQGQLVPEHKSLSSANTTRSHNREAGPKVTIGLSLLKKKRRIPSSVEKEFSRPKKSFIWKDSIPIFQHDNCNYVSSKGPSDSRLKNAELKLFGSKQKGSRVFLEDRDNPHRPPEVLSVNLGCSRQKSSVKQKVLDSWLKSHQPTKLSCRRKLKRKRYTSTLLREHPKKRVQKTEELPLGSERRFSSGNPKICLTLKRCPPASPNKRDAELNMTYMVTHGQPNPERANERGSPVIESPEKSALSFGVLSNTFTFTDESNRRRTTGGTSDVDAGRMEKNIPGKRGTWHQATEKTYRPLSKSMNPEVFKEYKQKYMMKNKPTTKL